MREYIDVFGKKHDLDNPKTYDYLPSSIKKLENMILRDYGWACAYIPRDHSTEKLNELMDRQLEQVEVFMDNYWKYRLEKSYSKDLIWFKEQAFILENMIENLC